MSAFEEQYWRDNYARPELMDGIFNAAEHADYLQSFFRFEYVHIESVIDFGFGLGHLFEAVLQAFMPFRGLGIEPSRHAFRQVKQRGIKPTDSMRLGLRNEAIEDWCERQTPRSRGFDLGLCTSVLQYLSDEEIAVALPVIASKVKYLYLTVPTDIELQRQASELRYRDQYARHRSRARYLELIRPHFTVLSARILESKTFFDEHNSAFTDLLFRF